MRKYVTKRVLQIVLTLYIYLTLVFFILQAMPGDISDFYLSNPKIPPAAREALRHQLGLDKPLFIQYLNSVKNSFTGNLGVSFAEYPRPVWDIIMERLPRTVVLFLSATLVSFAIGFSLGKTIAWRRGAAIEYSSTVVGSIFFTAFLPMFALVMIWAFAFKLNLFPIGKFINPQIWRDFSVVAGVDCTKPRVSCANVVFGYMLWTAGALLVFSFLVYLLSRMFPNRATRKVINIGGLLAVIGAISWLLGTTTVGYLATDILWHLILPVATLTLYTFAGTMLLMRNSMLETLREDYVMAAKAKGLPEKVVRDKHAARNALLPVVTSFVLAIATSVDGGVITETLFSWPGMGWTLLNSTLGRDYPLAIGTLVFTGIFVLVAHLVADVLYAYLDPRIRY